jgi:hypothetical protein
MSSLFFNSSDYHYHIIHSLTFALDAVAEMQSCKPKSELTCKYALSMTVSGTALENDNLLL